MSDKPTIVPFKALDHLRTEEELEAYVQERIKLELRDVFTEFKNDVQNRLNVIVAPARITPTRQEYWTHGARTVIREIDRAFLAIRQKANLP